ncbi:MAG: DUF1002 domain-containing protein [Clostridiales bacterium]
MKYRFLGKLSVTIFILILLFSISSNIVYADSFKTVTLGGDLNEDQKKKMLDSFGVTEEDANIIEVSIDEEKKYLSEIVSDSLIGTKSISCSFVEPTENSGLNISVSNLSWVNENMIRNALITAGIQNADVQASAPFKVSGTAALTGIMKGFESSKGGNKIDEEQKKVANEELVVTGTLGDKIGRDEASGLINEVKKEVVKENPDSKEDIEDIVINITNNYNYELNDDDIEEITALMVKINELGLDFSKIENSLNAVGKSLKDTLSSDKVFSFLETISNKFKEAPVKIIILSVVFFIFGLVTLINPLFTITLAKSISTSTNGTVRIAGIVIIIISIVLLF